LSTVLIYRDGRRQHEGPMDLDRAAEICVQGDGGLVWLGMFEPSPDELAEVQHRFGLHDLAVEDAQSFHLRPKIEQYDDGGVYFAVLRTARYVEDRDAIEFGEVSVFMSSRFVITVRQGVASDLHGARLRLERRPELLKDGPAAILWAILDKVVDDYAPVLEGLEQDVEEVEATVFSGADRADLHPAPRGDRLLPRRAPAPRPTRRARARQLPRGQPRAHAVLPRRQRSPQHRLTRESSRRHGARRSMARPFSASERDALML
jgi:Mg2+ and Co2+ transporter CorA